MSNNQSWYCGRCSICTNGRCRWCGGSGTISVNCRSCRGTGIYRTNKGWESECNRCNGTGSLNERCNTCRGSGDNLLIVSNCDAAWEEGGGKRKKRKRRKTKRNKKK